MTAKPNNAGKRLMAHVIDDTAATDPNRTVCIIPKGSSVSDGFVDFTFKQLANAVNYTAWWIEKVLGRSSAQETLTYIGANDMRYMIVVAACNKTGYKPLLSSTRNSDEAHLHLLNETKCSKMLFGVEREKIMAQIKSLRPGLDTIELPSLGEMLEGEAVHYQFAKTFNELEDVTAFIIHSSGTTGMPKPVYLTHGFLGAMENSANLPMPAGRESGIFPSLRSDELFFVTTPFFHLMGFAALVTSVFLRVPCVMAPDKPMSAEVATEMINATRPTAAAFPPSILTDMVNYTSSVEALSRLKLVYYAGGPLSFETGELLSKKTKVLNFLGSSEVGFINTLIPEHPEDWQYFEWNQNYGIDMQPVGDGLFEMVMRRSETRDFNGIFHTFPDLNEYHTKDLFTPHPTRPSLWRFHGRLDDVIVLSNGEKFNPVTMEETIEGHPLVSRAVVVGQGRFQSALLIEPNWNLWSEDKPENELIERIWPAVQQANHVGPAHGRIMRAKIGVSSPRKPFKTTAKGSTQRRFVIQDYEAEINDIYAKSDYESAATELPGDATLHNVQDYVRGVVSTMLESELADQTDFYTAGFDSLLTMQLSKLLQTAIRSHHPAESALITPQKIYANPTVEQLSQFVYAILHGSMENEVSRTEKIDNLIEKYTTGLPKQTLNIGSVEKHAVILTGSTGSLGNYLLNLLVNDAKVFKVYCLNRSDARDRQIKSFHEKGLAFDSNAEAKVEFLTASFGAESLGLDSSKYDEMVKSVDTIIHNAWRVDFNISVDSFADVHIQSVRRFVDFSLQSAHRAHIHFVSSVSTIGAWNPANGSIPETPLEDCKVVLPQGYGESKHVGERICLEASRRAGVPATIHRVGQIAGPTTEKGMWSRQEWLPTIIATSKAIGRVPNTLGSMPIDWIPVDKLAAIMLELVDSRRSIQGDSRCDVFHLFNPSVTSWKSLLPAIQDYYPVQPVELSEWIKDLERIQNPSAEDIAAKPALKLLDFYRGLAEGEGPLSAPIELTRTKKASKTMRSLGPISGVLMANWMRQWAF